MKPLRTTTFTDTTRLEGVPDGALLHLAPKRALEAFENKLRARDGCVRTSFVAIDPYVTISAVARLEKFGQVKMKYSFEADMMMRTVRLSRGFSGQQDAAYADLVKATPCPLLYPPGTPNVLELRVQGPTLEARVNDQHAMTIHDPVLGIGAFGVRVETKQAAPTHQRVLVQWLEVRQVIA